MARFALPPLESVPGGGALASLSRRIRALIVAGVLFVVLFVLVLTLTVPYVILSPGPTCNTLGKVNDANCIGTSSATVVVINGKQPAKTSGHLNLTTVSEGDKVTAFQAFVGWLKSDETVVPYSSVNPPGQSEQATQAQNAADFVSSQDSAVAAASCQLGYPKKFGVAGVESTGAAYNKLQPGDVLTAVDGQATTSQTALLGVLSKTKPGDVVKVGLVRAGKATSVSVTLGAAVKGRTGGTLGITVGSTCAAPFDVTFGLTYQQVGGPSAGLMFALGIVDKAGSQDLTGGRFIAGTGEIDAAGNVSPIGGIALKMIAARRAGATVFLAPAGNCQDVVGAIPGGLTVVKVSTLSGAVSDLLRIQKGQSVPSC